MMIIDRKEIEYLTNFRKKLHQYPELSGEEVHTAEAIFRELKRCNPTEIITNLGGNGIAAVFGNETAKVSILFRAELDALPIQEINTFAHRSVKDGISHKCGHDGHSTILLGLARQIKKTTFKDKKIILLFQPAEEDGTGAMAVSTDQRFIKLKPDYVFAIHNVPGYNLGEIIIKTESFTPAVTSIKIALKGKTSHAAEPEFGINPDMAIHDLISAVKGLAYTNMDSGEFCLVTTVYASLGSKDYGISAGEGELHFTIRCWTVEKLGEVKKEVELLIKKISSKYDLSFTTYWFFEFYPNKNNAKAVEFVKCAAIANSYDILEKEKPFKWGEDFGLFTQKFKGAMFALGAGKQTPALHNPDYDFPDDLLPIGIHMFSSIIKAVNA